MLRVDAAAFGVPESRRKNLWALRVTGDSMIGANIQSGDLGIFERREPHPGDIIAALVDGTSTTLKRLVKVRGQLVLRAENKNYADIVPTERLECQGVMVGLVRRMAMAG
jgi:repressor LexA